MEHLTDTRQARTISFATKKMYAGKPTFVTVPESFQMTKDMAAEILKKSTIPIKTHWANYPIFPPNYTPPGSEAAAVSAPVDIVSPEQYRPGKDVDCVVFKPSILPEGKLESFDDLFISKEPLLSGKHSFIITDTSAHFGPSERPVLVRELDGTLRKASYEERRREVKFIYVK